MSKQKLILIPLLLLFLTLPIFAEKSPIESDGKYWEEGILLKGKWFYDISESFREQDGWAYIKDFGKLHYWLYDTYTYWEDDREGAAKLIINRYVPVWIESMGYVIDFDNIKVVDPNEVLASSVKSLMNQRGCDISVIINEQYHDVRIHLYDRKDDTYWSIIYPFIVDSQISSEPKSDRKTAPQNITNTSSQKTDNSKYNPDKLILDITVALNKNGKSTAGDKFYENLKTAKDAGKRTTKPTDQFGNELPDNAYEYIVRMLNKARGKGSLSKHTILAVQYECMVQYSVPSNFKIAKGMSELDLAKVINSLPYKGL